jgi:hypothetical protein
MMLEIYAATLVGVVCGAAAVAALQLSRELAPAPYTAIHVITIVVMIGLVTLGYESIPTIERYADAGLSRMLYVVVSWLAFMLTMLIHRQLQLPSRAEEI